MRRIWATFRAVALVALLLAVLMPAGLYLALSTPWVQGRLCGLAASGLSEVLGSEVRVGNVIYHPFNRIVVEDVGVDDDFGEEALKIKALNLRFELFKLLRDREIEIDYVVIDGLDLRVSRASADLPVNVSKMIKRLKGDGSKRGETLWRLSVNTLVVRDGSASYDVMSEELRADGVFDANHMKVSGLQLYAYLPCLSNDSYDVQLEHLSFTERGGFQLDDLRAGIVADTAGVSLSEVRAVLPHSRLAGSVDIDADFFGVGKSVRHFAAELMDVRLYMPDLASFVPALGVIDRVAELRAVVEGSPDCVSLTQLEFSDGQGVSGEVSGEIVRNACEGGYEIPAVRAEVRAEGTDAADMLKGLPGSAARKAGEYLSRMGFVNLSLDGSGSPNSARAAGEIVTGIGAVSVDLSAKSDDDVKSYTFDAEADLRAFDVGRMLANSDIGALNGHIESGGKVLPRRKDVSGTVAAEITGFSLRGYTYNNVGFKADVRSLRDAEASISIDDDNVRAAMALVYGKEGERVSLSGDVKLVSADLGAMGLTRGYQGCLLCGEAVWMAEGSCMDDAEAEIGVSGLSFVDAGGASVTMDGFSAALKREDEDYRMAELTVSSDFVDGVVAGRIVPTSLVPMLKQAVSAVAPALVDGPTVDLPETNDFTFEFSVKNAEDLSTFFKLPLHVIYPVDIDGRVDGVGKSVFVNIDAPYLQRGEDIIDNTSVNIFVDGTNELAKLYATTHMPTKKGPLAVVAGVSGVNNRFDTRIDWEIERKIPLRGQIDFSTLFERSDDCGLSTEVSINPGEITFGDALWHLEPAKVVMSGGKIDVDGFVMSAEGQSLSADGRVGAGTDDVLRARLVNLTLGDIFETLEIDKALIGGNATGEVTASALLSKSPMVETDNLHVDNISYNYCVLGDADIRACLDNDKQSFYLDADITEPGGRHSRIYGDIFPASESLDLNFDADHVKVGFMKPFMEAFASDVDGYASGHARLFGTFKYIDMEGDIFAEDLRLKIDFTNTWYEATDSIRIRPGIINLEDITIKDVNGHTAKLDGFVKHTFFKAPEFDFRISEARDFLSYDVGSKQSPDWYGTIYGNGVATVSGAPGIVNIGVNMSTAPHSVFTFVLSDRLDADEYSFINFRDVTPEEISDTLTNVVVPEAVLEFQKRMQARNTDEPSTYNMDFRIDITPEAQMVIVMDPVGGDRIKSNGTGNLRMTYNSTENDLRMYGTYSLIHGSYNFTLQDIIIKDFTIKDGSSITFRGDPYSAQLGIEAVYSVNANLSDLDESFLQDKDLNRTNVPVHALLKVTGDMRQPDIAFDLEFPTLTSDTYRKVRSIISTDEMMNRQIIYLLALNRFYTPDYMASTTKGNELFSVASSTISSQLSSMLGKLSDNWSIAPNLRSDRGDFSDVEVDLMLSSRLLDNRLLFNGNFGYRDKSLNTNQFIGDFDIEYLLNRRGTWRLKAYNRYNDQNYYVRTAQTTQGVGIVLKRDFDNIFSFLRRMRKSSSDTAAEKDSVPAHLLH